MILLVFPHWLHIDCSQALSHSLGCVLRSTGEQLTHVWLSSDENRHVIALFFLQRGSADLSGVTPHSRVCPYRWARLLHSSLH